MRGAAALVLLCGCRGLLGIDGVSDPPNDAAIDAPDPAVDGSDASLGVCPANFEVLAGLPHRYLMIFGPDTFLSQVNDCEALGATIYLAIPDNEPEVAALGAFAGDDFWVGIDDIAIENQFETVKGDGASFLPWAANQPDNFNNSDCVRVIAASQQFDDTICTDSLPAVCECEP